MICDPWRLEVEEAWRLLDLNPIVQKNHVLKLHKTHGCVVDGLNFFFGREEVERCEIFSWRWICG